MGLITSAGIGSGIDLESIIQAILDAETAPKEASLRRNEQRVESSLSAIGQLSSGLSTLSDSLENLSSLSDFRIKAATVSDDTVLSVSTNTETSDGDFEIEVGSLASGSRLESIAGTFSDISDTVGSGILTFTAGANTFNIPVDALDSLETIRDNINSDSNNFGVNANIINGGSGPVLVFTSTITGDANTLVVTNNNASLDSISTNLDTTEPATNANITIDGINISSETNTFTNAVQDLTITVLKETDPATSVNLSIATDIDGIKESINSFVDAINEFQTTAQRLGQSSELATGPLAGDVTLRILTQSVNSALTDPVSGLSGDFSTLNSIGITFDQFGKLTVDETALDEAINTNFENVSQIFAKDNDGVAIKVVDLVDNYTSFGGILDIREDSLNSQKRRLEDDRANFDYRISQLETQLRAKFGAADSLIAQFNNTGAFLAQQLASLPNVNRSQD